MSLTVTRNATATLADRVSALKAGDAVRVNIAHKPAPVVGFLRTARRSLVEAGAGPLLIVDVQAGYIVRDHLGRPGFSIRDVEVITDEAPLGEDEKLELLVAHVLDFCSTRASLGHATGERRDRLANELAQKKAAILDLYGGVL